MQNHFASSRGVTDLQSTLNTLGHGASPFQSRPRGQPLRWREHPWGGGTVTVLCRPPNYEELHLDAILFKFVYLMVN